MAIISLLGKANLTGGAFRIRRRGPTSDRLLRLCSASNGRHPLSARSLGARRAAHSPGCCASSRPHGSPPTPRLPCPRARRFFCAIVSARNLVLRRRRRRRIKCALARRTSLPRFVPLPCGSVPAPAAVSHASPIALGCVSSLPCAPCAQQLDSRRADAQEHRSARSQRTRTAHARLSRPCARTAQRAFVCLVAARASFGVPHPLLLVRLAAMKPRPTSRTAAAAPMAVLSLVRNSSSALAGTLVVGLGSC